MHKLLFGASKTCANCGQGGASISCHQKCGEAYYCEDSCRSNHASAHRRLCVTTREFGIEDGSDTESEREDQQDDNPRNFSKSFEERIQQKILERWEKDQPKRIQAAVADHLKQLQPETASVPSQETVSSQNNLKDRELKFFIWRGGNVGFQLRMDISTSQVQAHSLDTESPAWLEGIRSSDVLVSVNGQNVSGISAKEALRQIEAADTPAILRFHSSPALSACENTHRYTISWGYDKLGVSIKSDDGRVPIVHRVIPNSTKRGIIPGDILVAINQTDTLEIGCRATLKVLMTIQRPAQLTFQRNGPSPTVQDATSRKTDADVHITPGKDLIQVEWVDGLLGIALARDRTAPHYPIIDKFTQKRKGLKKKDQLIRINGISVVPNEFESTCEQLRTASRPCVLEFKRTRDAVAKSKVSNRSLYYGAYYSRMSSQNPTEMQNEYEVLWKGQALGIVLGFRWNEQKQRVPFVRKIDSKVSSLKFPKRCVGDSIVAINNIQTIGLHRSELIELFNSVATFPAVLRFRPSVSNHKRRQRLSSICAADTTAAYSLVWHNGDLGITFTPDGLNRVMVQRAVATGTTSTSSKVCVGDILQSLNGKDVMNENQKFMDVIHLLQQAAKPVVLGFIRV